MGQEKERKESGREKDRKEKETRRNESKCGGKANVCVTVYHSVNE
jgi:hypothetical protein